MLTLLIASYPRETSFSHSQAHVIHTDPSLPDNLQTIPQEREGCQDNKEEAGQGGSRSCSRRPRDDYYHGCEGKEEGLIRRRRLRGRPHQSRQSRQFPQPLDFRPGRPRQCERQQWSRRFKFPTPIQWNPVSLNVTLLSLSSDIPAIQAKFSHTSDSARSKVSLR